MSQRVRRTVLFFVLRVGRVFRDIITWRRIWDFSIEPYINFFWLGSGEKRLINLISPSDDFTPCPVFPGLCLMVVRELGYKWYNILGGSGCRPIYLRHLEPLKQLAAANCPKLFIAITLPAVSRSTRRKENEP